MGGSTNDRVRGKSIGKATVHTQTKPITRRSNIAFILNNPRQLWLSVLLGYSLGNGRLLDKLDMTGGFAGNPVEILLKLWLAK
jgi:hypothetical protein